MFWTPVAIPSLRCFDMSLDLNVTARRPFICRSSFLTPCWRFRVCRASNDLSRVWMVDVNSGVYAPHDSCSGIARLIGRLTFHPAPPSNIHAQSTPKFVFPMLSRKIQCSHHRKHRTFAKLWDERDEIDVSVSPCPTESCCEFNWGQPPHSDTFPPTLIARR
ncbi:hypothetical protein BJ912DRAFT_92058 [Pholiota molesta]|nr:hypothetical protein BJ912DRAFT_92058 [Pholiota molesta]